MKDFNNIKWHTCHYNEIPSIIADGKEHQFIYGAAFLNPELKKALGIDETAKDLVLYN